MKKILFLTTDGTIASSSNEESLAPSLTSEEILHYLDKHRSDIEIACRDLLRLNFSNVQPRERQLTARCTAEVKNGHDGIVLSHGTDTMAYTAGALSFMLCNLDIPLIITGSQLPLLRPLSDDAENTHVVFTAVCEDIQGVYVCFDRRIMLAAHVAKVRMINFDAFESVNIRLCGRVDVRDLRMNKQLLVHPMSTFALEDELCKEVVLIRLIPGMDPLLFNKLMETGIRGTVIEALGTEGINFVRRDLVNKLETIVVRGVSVIICSQCFYEYSDLSVYQAGQKVLWHGMIQGCDVTGEACVTKLMWALGKSTDTKEVKRISETGCINEITLPQACVVLLKNVKQKPLSIGGPQLAEGFYFLMSAKQHESRGQPFILLLSV